jgi:ribosomal protein S18 acetylase RimI-like enzyme
MEVRPARRGDLHAIAEVHVRCWHETYTGLVAQAYLDSLSVEQRLGSWTSIHSNTYWPAAGILVLVAEHAVAGFAHLCPSRDVDAQAHTGEITSIYVLRAQWHKGGGQALMTAALVSLSQAGFTTASLWVLDTNQRARRFYEINGWQFDGTVRDDTIGGEPTTELRYKKSLV